MKILKCDKCGSDKDVKTYERYGLQRKDAKFMIPAPEPTRVQLSLCHDGISLPVDYVRKELCQNCVDEIERGFQEFAHHYLSIFNS